MANGSTVGGDWIRTLSGAAGAITTVFVLGHFLIIEPMTERQKIFESDLKEARKDVANAYTLIQTNDQYKKLVEEWKDSLRRDLNKTDALLHRIELTQQQRTTAVASVASLERRIDRIDQRTEENERRLSPTIIDEVKNLRSELQDLRRRIMVPANGMPKE